MDEPDFAEMERIGALARSADERIALEEARLFLSDDFNELLKREKALEQLYAKRRELGDALLKAASYRRLNPTAPRGTDERERER